MPESATIRLGSSLRNRTSRQTCEIAAGYMSRLGISRVTQITRMDRLGLPVFASVRPRSLTLRVNAGKGIAEMDAKAGALMEALEFAIAEPDATPWQKHTITIRELVARFPQGLQLVDLIPRTGVEVAPDDPVAVVTCENLATGESLLLPAQLVFMPFFPEHGPNLFGSGTNGLASGNSVDEATLHGLLEVLERDTITMNRPHDQSQWVDPASFPEPFLSLTRKWSELGVDLMVRHVPGEFGLPCFHAILHEPDSDNINLSGGYGLHPDAEIALSRAICEAAQSRLSHIHGGRDDITDFYAKYQDWQPLHRKGSEANLLAAFTNKARQARFSGLRIDWPQGTIAQHLSRLLRQLAELGFGPVCRHVYAANMPELAVVRVIVPKCEYVEHQAKRIGPRLMKRIISHA